MSKLWQKKNIHIDKKIEEFTVGNDYILDHELIVYDCLASLAHAEMLYKIGILSKDDLKNLRKGLKEIYLLSMKGLFKIRPEDEDCHTAIENYLTKKYPGAGKKIHTGRSRNDQVLTALRLFEKEKLLQINELVLNAALKCVEFAKKYEFVPIPGYTHFQQAMLSSVGLLYSSYAESLLSDSDLILSIYNCINSSPLGSAAGYGVSIPIDRKMTSKLLGFRDVQNNVLYVQNSRGKFELSILHSYINIALTINKICSDLILFTTKEFGFFSLPQEITTGSSIMPQKKNPDVIELLRAKSNSISGYYNEILSIIKNLPSGYHRDFQLTKEPVLKSSKIIVDSLDIFNFICDKIIINDDKCTAGISQEIYAADAANQLVFRGIPFREAYKQSLNEINTMKFDPIKNLKSKKHMGAAGNLGLNVTLKTIKAKLYNNKLLKDSFQNVIDKLIH